MANNDEAASLGFIEFELSLITEKWLKAAKFLSVLLEQDQYGLRSPYVLNSLRDCELLYLEIAAHTEAVNHMKGNL